MHAVPISLSFFSEICSSLFTRVYPAILFDSSPNHPCRTQHFQLHRSKLLAYAHRLLYLPLITSFIHYLCISARSRIYMRLSASVTTRSLTFDPRCQLAAHCLFSGCAQATAQHRRDRVWECLQYSAAFHMSAALLARGTHSLNLFDRSIPLQSFRLLA